MTVVGERPPVDPAYRHAPKHARPAPSIVLGEAVLKWYDVAPPDDPVPDDRALARHDELWETVWAKLDDDDPGFHPWPLEPGHRPTFCVWELGAVAHEREAWGRYLVSERDDEARRAYLRDVFEGPV